MRGSPMGRLVCHEAGRPAKEALITTLTVLISSAMGIAVVELSCLFVPVAAGNHDAKVKVDFLDAKEIDLVFVK